MVLKKATVQVLLLLIGMAMSSLASGVAEAQTVFSKAIRLCMECMELAKKKQRNKRKCRFLHDFVVGFRQEQPF